MSFNAGGHGEWSDTTQSMTPTPSARHSASLLGAYRTGGQHLYSVAPAGTSSAAKER